MNHLRLFDASDRTFDLLFMGVFAIGWVAFKFGTSRFVAHSPTPQSKKLWSDRFSVFEGILVFLFVSAAFASSTKPDGRTWLVVFICGTIIGLLTWLTIRFRNPVKNSPLP